MNVLRRYRKRPVTVEAQQWHPGVQIQGVNVRQFASGADRQLILAWFDDADGEPRKVRPGDWVVRDNDGELHVYRDAKFRDLFEVLP